MKLSRQQFLDWEFKHITLLAMSGAGKTTLANKLPKNKWFHYSADYRIGTKYLGEQILDNIKRQAMSVPFLRDLLLSDSIYIQNNITVDNLAPVSSFLGKIGNSEKGGLPLAEFKRRQRLHHQAEVAALKDVPDFIRKAEDIYGYKNFLNDAGGSVCELDEPEVLDLLAEHSVIIYIRIPPALEQTLIARAQANPKPLYYRESFLDQALVEYTALHPDLAIDNMDPNEFVTWVFPKLYHSRVPRYEAIAEQYGYTIDAGDTLHIQNEQDFIHLIADAIGQKEKVSCL
jgi:hypothetical protein